MSSSLIRRGLDLYKEDDVVKNRSGKTKRGKSGSNTSKPANNLTEEEICGLVGTNKKGFRRKLKRLHSKQTIDTLKGKKVKSHDILHEAHMHRDKTDANVKALSFMKLLNNDEKRIMEQAAQRHEAKHSLRKPKKSQKSDSNTNNDQQCVFTEEDFEKFFKEYNFT